MRDMNGNLLKNGDYVNMKGYITGNDYFYKVTFVVDDCINVENMESRETYTFSRGERLRLLSIEEALIWKLEQ